MRAANPAMDKPTTTGNASRTTMRTIAPATVPNYFTVPGYRDFFRTEVLVTFLVMTLRTPGFDAGFLVEDLAPGFAPGFLVEDLAAGFGPTFFATAFFAAGFAPMTFAAPFADPDSAGTGL